MKTTTSVHNAPSARAQKERAKGVIAGISGATCLLALLLALPVCLGLTQAQALLACAPLLLLCAPTSSILHRVAASTRETPVVTALIAAVFLSLVAGACLYAASMIAREAFRPIGGGTPAAPWWAFFALVFAWRWGKGLRRATGLLGIAGAILLLFSFLDRISTMSFPALMTAPSPRLDIPSALAGLSPLCALAAIPPGTGKAGTGRGTRFPWWSVALGLFILVQLGGLMLLPRNGVQGYTVWQAAASGEDIALLFPSGIMLTVLPVAALTIERASRFLRDAVPKISRPAALMIPAAMACGAIWSPPVILYGLAVCGAGTTLYVAAQFLLKKREGRTPHATPS